MGPKFCKLSAVIDKHQNTFLENIQGEQYSDEEEVFLGASHQTFMDNVSPKKTS